MSVDELVSNGRLRGRAVPPLPTFVFASTGRAIQIRRLSGDTMLNIRRAVRKDMPAPEVPLVMEPGPDGDMVEARNLADPDYQLETAVWEDAVGTESSNRLQKLIETYATVCEIDREEVNRYRDAMTLIGASVEERSDMSIYLWEICGPAQADKIDLINFVLSRSQPTAEAVQAHTASFRDDVQGPPAA